jgi:hypothetical protein
MSAAVIACFHRRAADAVITDGDIDRFVISSPTPV